MTHRPRREIFAPGPVGKEIVLFTVLLLAAPALAQQREAGEAQLKQMRAQAGVAHHELWQRFPMVGLPLIAEENAPTIDGEVGTREWFNAAQIAYLLDMSRGIQVQEKTTIYMAYTDTHLYVAFQFQRPEAARVPTKQDFFEVLFDTNHDHETNLNFAAGLEEILWDGRGTPLIDKSWSANWNYAARQAHFGWEGEFAVPFADLGFDGAPEAGSTWGFDWVRNERTPQDRLATWSFRGQDWHALENYGHIRFMGEPVAFAVESIGWDSGERRGGVRVRVSNFSDSTYEARVLSQIRRAETPPTEPYYPRIEGAMTEDLPAAIGAQLTDEIQSALDEYDVIEQTERALAVPAQQSRVAELFIDDEPGPYTVGFAVYADEELVAGGLVPFDVAEPLAVSINSYLYSAHQVEAKVDLRRVLDKVAEDSTVELTFLGPDDKVLDEQTLTQVHGRERVTGWLSAEPISGANCRVVAKLTRGGEVVAERAAALRVPERPAWLANGRGRELAVPEPWTPVQAARERTAVWGRQFMWTGESILPELRVKDQRILSEPMSLTFADGAGEALSLHMRSWELAESSEDEAVYRFEAALGDAAALRGTVTVSFDGMVWYELSLEPNASMTLGAATFEAPVDAAFAQLLTTGKGEADDRQQYAGAVPADGLTAPFRFAFWVGNLDDGLQWFAENNRNWSNADELDVVRIEPTDEAVTLRVKMVDQPTELAEPIEWKFGFVPTPSRPKPRHWGEFGFFQSTGMPGNGTEGAEAYVNEALPAIKPYAVIFFSQWTELFGYPGTQNPETAEQLRTNARVLEEHDIKTLVYAGWGVNTEAPMWNDFGREMIRLPIRNSGYGTYRQCPAGLFNDFFVEHVAQMIENEGIHGIYLDSVASPVYCEAPHGCGWRDEDGELRGSYPILATRDMYRRFYTLVHGGLIEDGVIYNHQSPPAVVPIEGLSDVRHPSEFAQFHEGEFDGEFVDYFLAKNGGEQFGLYAELTNKNWMDPPKTVNQVLAVGLPQHIGIKAIVGQKQDWIPLDYSVKGQPMPKIWAANRWLGMKEARYLPYWRNSEYVTVSPDRRALSALWLRPGERALLCVSNLATEARSLHVELNLEACELDNIELQDAITGETIEHSNGHFEIKIDSERYRLLKVIDQ